MTYYNTTGESGENLESYTKKTATQDNRIANFFEQNPGEIYTPWEVQSLVFTPPMPPVTSVRRSISDLTRAGILTKTLHRKETGSHGRRSYCWTLNERYRETLGIMQDIFAPEDPQEVINDEITPPPVYDPTKERKSIDGSPQGILFETPTLEPVECVRCGKMLTTARSIIQGMGPVCVVRCERRIG
jgi:hypothetical protein